MIDPSRASAMRRASNRFMGLSAGIAFAIARHYDWSPFTVFCAVALVITALQDE